MCKIVNLYKEPYDVYIGRSRKGEPFNKWCNPFVIDKSNPNSLSEVLDKYRKYLWKEIKSGNITVEDLKNLDVKVLGCFCKPKDCHGDIIIKAVEWAKLK